MCLCEEKTFQILIIEKSERFLFYFIIYKIDKEYYELKNHTKPQVNGPKSLQQRKSLILILEIPLLFW